MELERLRRKQSKIKMENDEQDMRVLWCSHVLPMFQMQMSKSDYFLRKERHT